ncbi:MAG: phytanoyl-CoA dioxygenase family protein, partial [Pseudomonadota bacterium]
APELDDQVVRDQFYRGQAHLLLPIVAEIARAPAVVAAVTSVLGPDVLLWMSSLFIKEPRTADFVGWHQDLHYWGLDGTDEVTAWVALTPATPQNGCMRFVAGSHRSVVEHVDTANPDNMLSRQQEVAVEVDEAEATEVVLDAGEFSLHHGNLFHASHPNGSGDRRIGLALRYISPELRQAGVENPRAMLISGEDTSGRYRLVSGPQGAFDPAALQLVREIHADQRQVFFADTPQTAA